MLPRPISPRSMSSEQTAAEADLKAFERRMTEVVTTMRPSARRWQLILAMNGLALLIGGYRFISDTEIYNTPSLLQHYCNHTFFLIVSIIFFILLCYGAHHRVVAPDMIVARTRHVLADFNMSCDDNGRLLLHSRPAQAL